jgi:hypothetical protein
MTSDITLVGDFKKTPSSDIGGCEEYVSGIGVCAIASCMIYERIKQRESEVLGGTSYQLELISSSEGLVNRYP